MNFMRKGEGGRDWKRKWTNKYKGQKPGKLSGSQDMGSMSKYHDYRDNE
jgi:hypothetical protein